MKKFLLIKECLGTEPYVNSRLEMDIKDIIEYAVIPSEEEDEHDIVKIIQQSDDRDELIEMMNMHEQSDYYLGF